MIPGIVDPASLATSATKAGQDALISLIGNLFGSRPNPNDWVGWNAQDVAHGQYDKGGSSIMAWIINDGDSVQNEASNIVSAIKNLYGGDLTFLTKKSGPQPTSNGPITPSQLAGKMMRAGGQYAAIGDQLASQLQAIYDRQNKVNMVRTNTLTITPDVSTPPPPPAKKDNTWLIVGIVAAVLVIVGVIVYSVVKSKK